jgi:cyclase
VYLIEVGPAHPRGDVLVHVPKDRVVYTGDILFIDGTPIAWAGPVRNWIKACDRIMAMDVDAIVPGHGPITDKPGVRRMQEYLEHVDRETRKRHAAGMGSWEAAQDIALGSFGAWEDAGRLAVTVDTIYREIDRDAAPPNVVELLNRVMQLEKRYAPGRAGSR